MDYLDRARDLYEKAVKAVSKTETEKKLAEALSNANWGASTTLLREIAHLTNDWQEYAVIMRETFAALSQEPRYWRQIFKALTLLEYLVKNGAERCVQEARDRIHSIRALSGFSFFVEGGEKGAGVREKAKALLELIQDDARVREERERARELRDKYTGIGRDGMSRGVVSSRPPGFDSGMGIGGAASGLGRYNDEPPAGDAFGGAKDDGDADKKEKKKEKKSKKKNKKKQEQQRKQSEEDGDSGFDDLVGADDDDDDFGDFAAAAAGNGAAAAEEDDFFGAAQPPAAPAPTPSAPTASPSFDPFSGLAAAPSMPSPVAAAPPATPRSDDFGGFQAFSGPSTTTKFSSGLTPMSAAPTPSQRPSAPKSTDPLASLVDLSSLSLGPSPGKPQAPAAAQQSAATQQQQQQRSSEGNDEFDLLF